MSAAAGRRLGAGGSVRGRLGAAAASGTPPGPVMGSGRTRFREFGEAAAWEGGRAVGWDGVWEGGAAASVVSGTMRCPCAVARAEDLEDAAVVAVAEVAAITFPKAGCWARAGTEANRGAADLDWLRGGAAAEGGERTAAGLGRAEGPGAGSAARRGPGGTELVMRALYSARFRPCKPGRGKSKVRC